MKTHLIAALTLAGLAACTGDKEATPEEGASVESTTPNAQLASFKIDGMT